MTASITTTGLELAPGKWALDKNHSAIFFVVRHLGLSNVRGRFDAFEATVDIGATLDDVLGADAWARARAASLIEQMGAARVDRS